MAPQKLADVLVAELVSFSLPYVYLITGGGAMHLNDAFGRHRNAFTICHNHHEQASAMAAEAYARLTGKPAILNVTTGPGGINALNGVYGAYTDSIPMIVISGQIKRDTMLVNSPLPLRQLGDQEVDIISMVRGITKYAVELQDPTQVRKVIAKAVYVATHGRPGPVWIDVPMDLQGMKIDADRLPTWEPTEEGLRELRGDPNLAKNSLSDFTLADEAQVDAAIQKILGALKNAKRPVLMAGNGVHLSGQKANFLKVGELLQCPLVAGWNAYDLIPNDHPCYAGRPGTVGDRAGNFAVQNADFLLTLGCRLNIRQVSYNWENFANRAFKVQVDADLAELHKHTMHNDMTVQADLAVFLPRLLHALEDWDVKREHSAYRSWCQERVVKYPVLPPANAAHEKINPYAFIHQLTAKMEDDGIVVVGNGSACVIVYQAGVVKKETRWLGNSGSASMGYDVPAAIGAALAAGGKKRVFCVAGDGSIMMNLQELATIAGQKLPIVILVLENEGYLSIRQTQEAYFADNIFGIDEKTGVHFPDFCRVATAFGLKTGRLERTEDTDTFLDMVMAEQGPALYSIAIDAKQRFEPKLMSRMLPDGSMQSPQLDDMYPFLSPDELAVNRIQG